MSHHDLPRGKLPHTVMSAAIVAAFVFTTSVQAAELVNVMGSVSVNHGQGFQPTSIGTYVVPGDRVRAADGSADIVYDNGCTVRVGPRQVVLVTSEPPVCSGGGLKDGGPVGAPAEEPLVAPWVVGSLTLGGAIGWVAALTNNNENASTTAVSP